MEQAVNRADVERSLWMCSGWEIEQAQVDKILAVVDGYARSQLVTPPPAPVTIADLPVEERAKLKRREDLLCDTAYRKGKREGQAEAAERPSPGLSPLPASPEPGTTYRAADGHLWLALGTAQEIPVPTVPGQRQSSQDQRRCSCCREFKELSEFSKDSSSSDGIRRQCKECEREARLTRKRRNAEGEAP